MTDPFVHPYIPNTAPESRAAMLAAVGAASVDEFYADMPAELRLERPLDLPEPFVAEQDLVRHVEGLLAKNVSTPATPELPRRAAPTTTTCPPSSTRSSGAASSSPRTPGEPYEDHGRFQALFEYQSLMAELLNMDVVNVPTYDGYQATATALRWPGGYRDAARIIVASDVLPDKLSKVRDYVRPYLDLVFVPTIDGTADVASSRALDRRRRGRVWLETPSYYRRARGATARDRRRRTCGRRASSWWARTRSATACSPRRRTRAPTSSAATSSRSACTSGSAGPTVASSPCTTTPRFMMEMPSRLFGLATTDVPGEYGFGDVAYDRTSFAHREEGKEWVGTAAALWGIAAGVYLALMGPQGMRELGETLLARTRYASSGSPRSPA